MFARAYVALANCYRDFSSPLQSQQESDEQIRMLLQKALALDNDLADAHAGLAAVKREDGDFSGATAALSRALSLDPNSVRVLQANQRHSMVMGDYERAMGFARRWCDLDPLSSRACESIPRTHLAAGRYDEAIEEFQRILETDPAFAPAQTGVGIAYIGKQLYPEAIAALEGLVEVERAPERIRFCLLAFAYARSGRTTEARAMLAEMERARERRSILPQLFAAVHAGLGENDLAFELLDRAYKDRSGPPLVKSDTPSVDMALEVLRGDRRYYDFAKRKGFSVR
jgi:serine/threonine-protein kinase